MSSLDRILPFETHRDLWVIERDGGDGHNGGEGFTNARER